MVDVGRLFSAAFCLPLPLCVTPALAEQIDCRALAFSKLPYELEVENIGRFD